MPSPSHTYHFNKDNKTADGPEMTSFLDEGNNIATAGTGTYLLKGFRGGPGALGVLPSGASYVLNSDGTVSLKLP